MNDDTEKKYDVFDCKDLSDKDRKYIKKKLGWRFIATVIVYFAIAATGIGGAIDLLSENSSEAWKLIPIILFAAWGIYGMITYGIKTGALYGNKYKWRKGVVSRKKKTIYGIMDEENYYQVLVDDESCEAVTPNDYIACNIGEKAIVVYFSKRNKLYCPFMFVSQEGAV